MTRVIGVDGGGTHVRAVIVDERAREIARAEAPGVVVSLQTADAAADAVREAVRGAAEAGRVKLPAAVLWAGLAGAGHEASRLSVERALVAAKLAERVHVGTDVEAAFFAAFPEGPGLMLIAGTGSIAWGRGPRGRLCRVGGWGQILGDEGGGYAIGLAAARAVVRAEDGRADPTTLQREVLKSLGLKGTDELVPWAASASKSDLAALVPVVRSCADGGDAAAQTILEEAVSDLEAHVTSILRLTGPWPTRPGLLLSGGLIAPGGTLREAVERRLAPHPVSVRPDEVDAALGAAMLALSALGVPRP